MKAHDLARALLNGPDLEVYIGFDDAPDYLNSLDSGPDVEKRMDNGEEVEVIALYYSNGGDTVE